MLGCVMNKHRNSKNSHTLHSNWKNQQVSVSFFLKLRISHKTVCPCFNMITSSTPAYLSDLLHLYSTSGSLPSSTDTCLLKIPLCKCRTKGDCAFCYGCLSVWNSLPLQIRNATGTNIDTLKSTLKPYLFNLQDSY